MSEIASHLWWIRHVPVRMPSRQAAPFSVARQ